MSKAEEDAAQQRNLDIRVALNDAYAAVKGQETTLTFATITFEELLDQQIERLEGKTLSFRPNELERVAQTEQKGLTAIAQIRGMPTSEAVPPDPDKDVNT